MRFPKRPVRLAILVAAAGALAVGGAVLYAKLTARRLPFDTLVRFTDSFAEARATAEASGKLLFVFQVVGKADDFSVC
jgi:hypothetical protein